MPKTYEPIATTTLSAGTATVTFSSIPQTYTDLIVVLNGRTDNDENIRLQFNSDTTNNYSVIALYGNGSTVTSNFQSNVASIGVGGVSSGSDEQGTVIIQIFNYSNTTTNKTVLSRANNSTYVQLRVGMRRSTQAISAITLTADAITFLSGATFTLYGIKAA
jgi:TPP-dependent trihydroxycyclohexane-1,2-dione (THcHDO) dehydratase